MIPLEIQQTAEFLFLHLIHSASQTSILLHFKSASARSARESLATWSLPQSSVFQLIHSSRQAFNQQILTINKGSCHLNIWIEPRRPIFNDFFSCTCESHRHSLYPTSSSSSAGPWGSTKQSPPPDLESLSEIWGLGSMLCKMTEPFLKKDLLLIQRKSEKSLAKTLLQHSHI